MTDIIERLKYFSGWSVREVPGVELSPVSALCWDAIDEIERLRGVAQAVWQPIETAPKDGSFIYVWFPDNGDEPVSQCLTCSWKLLPETKLTTGAWFAQNGGRAFRMDGASHWKPMDSPSVSSTDRAAPPSVALEAVLEKIAAKAREWAGNYKPHSDGQNTFVLFAEWVEGLSALTHPQPGGAVAGNERGDPAAWLRDLEVRAVNFSIQWGAGGSHAKMMAAFAGQEIASSVSRPELCPAEKTNESQS